MNREQFEKKHNLSDSQLVEIMKSYISTYNHKSNWIDYKALSIYIDKNKNKDKANIRPEVLKRLKDRGFNI